jgi:uncharacterized phage infection (PIP) family protein YhgE
VSERPTYKTQVTQALLLERRRAVDTRHKAAVADVDRLLHTQQDVSRELSTGLDQLGEQSAQLDALQGQSSKGIFAALVRPFTARRSALARRSIAATLMEQYEQVSTRLQEASGLSDDLKLRALELQAEVDQLHADVADALHDQKLAAKHVLELEQAIEEAEADPGMSEGERARRIDRFTFDLRTSAISLRMFQAAAREGRQHIEPARALRDTVLRLHEDMATFVLRATHTVNAAGRRITALGAVADAALVATELAASIEELSDALQAAADHADESNRYLASVLPQLTARLDQESDAQALAGLDDAMTLDRGASRAAAESTLRDAAQAEVDSFLSGDE